MKRLNSFFLLLSFAITACSLTVAKPPAAMDQSASEVALASTTVQVIPLAATSTLVMPSPVEQPAQPPALTPLPPPQAAPSTVIQFAPGGTWKDTQDSIPLGGSKTYTLNAMQGQIMSVSIVGGYFPLQIQGRDGTVLCPVEQNLDCSFWRGTLPLSQDYYITVKSGGDQANFTLRVAINPPGKAEQTFVYNANNITLSYSDQFAPANLPSVLSNKTNLQIALHLVDTSSYINTNLGEAYFVLGSSSDSQIVTVCTEPNQSGGIPETPDGNLKVNNYSFAYSTASDAGAGNIYDQRIYRAVNNGTCYEVIYFIHYSNIGNYSPGVVKEFDLKGLLQKFNGILSTIQLK